MGALERLGVGTLIRADGALRTTVREVVPFALRVGVRRAPSVLRWMTQRGAVCRSGLDGGVEICRRSSPLRRPGTVYDPRAQAGKEANVRRVVRALDGVVVAAGSTFSWHGAVGPPLRVRGFRAGPELHAGVLASGVGGGACQVANLVFWLGAMAGMEVVERHRHGQDLFPDSQRSVPFGCGATVFHPHRDLKLKNPHAVPLAFRLEVDPHHLHGVLLAGAPLECRWRLEERNPRFHRAEGLIWRSNTLVRVGTTASGESVEVLFDNHAKVAYPVDERLLEPR